jgi:hypothetical protein
MERVEAHQVLVEHLPRRDPRWLWLRYVCRACGGRHPCAERVAALDELAGQWSRGFDRLRLGERSLSSGSSADAGRALLVEVEHEGAWPDAVGPGPLKPAREADVDDEDLDDAAWHELAPSLLDPTRPR